MQGTSELKLKHRETYTIQFYKEYLQDDGLYPGLLQHAKKHFSLMKDEECKESTAISNDLSAPLRHLAAVNINNSAKF